MRAGGIFKFNINLKLTRTCTYIRVCHVRNTYYAIRNTMQTAVY